MNLLMSIQSYYIFRFPQIKTKLENIIVMNQKFSLIVV